MPLDFIVVGGGIAGLAAAIAVGRCGHRVDIFEKSAFSGEIGAALHLGPHACRLLNKLGVNIPSTNPCTCEEWRNYDWNGNVLGFGNLREKQQQYKVVEEEIMVHRADIHRALRDTALALDNVRLHLSSTVIHVNAAVATITLSDHQTYSADVIVGADGVHSRSIAGLLLDNPPPPPHKTGVSIDRFLLNVSSAMEKAPLAKEFLTSYPYKTTHTNFISTSQPSGSVRFLVIYPCGGGDILNCASFKNDHEIANVGVPSDVSDYCRPGTVQDILDQFSDWPDHWIELFKCAEDIKRWKMISRLPIKTFVCCRLVLIGDAAHPGTPKHGAGAAMAIEDAAVLGALFDRTVQPEEVESRLQLFNRLRFERATVVKCGSDYLGSGPEVRRKSEDLLATVIQGGTMPENMEQYLWPVDVAEEAEQALRVRCGHV